MMRMAIRTLAGLAVLALVAGCNGTGLEGGAGEPCLPDGSCDPGLVCNAANICEQPPAEGFTALYHTSSFQTCADCHAPNAPGFTEGTEATQDWSTRDTAYTSLQGEASGLIGNFAGCNGVPFIGATPEDSLLLAVFDDSVRAGFSLPEHPDCNADSISDMTLKIGGPLSATEMQLLRDWIADGAPDD